MNEELVKTIVEDVKNEGVELIDTVNIQTVVDEYGNAPVHEEEIKPIIEEVTEEKSIEE